MPVPNFGEQQLPQYSHKVFWTLSQHRSPALGSNIVTMFPQHCLNVVSTSVPNVRKRYCPNVYIMLPGCCLYVSPNFGDQHNHNIHTMLVCECCHNVGASIITTLAPMLCQCCHNTGALSGFCILTHLPGSQSVMLVCYICRGGIWQCSRSHSLHS